MGIRLIRSTIMDAVLSCVAIARGGAKFVQPATSLARILRINIALSLALAGIVGQVGSAQATFIDAGLTNGNFSTYGTSGGQTGTFGVAANSTDNHFFFAGWQAGRGDGLGGFESFNDEARIFTNASGSRSVRGYWIHDAATTTTTGTVSASIYKLTFDAKISATNVDGMWAGFLWSDTVNGTASTWQTNIFGGVPSHRWLNEWNFGPPGDNTYRTYTLYWDNTGSTTSTPWGGGPIPALTQIIYAGTSSGGLPVHVGDPIRVGFFWRHRTSSGRSYIDNVSLEIDVEDVAAVPEPSTLALAGCGLTGLMLVALRRRPKSRS